MKKFLGLVLLFLLSHLNQAQACSACFYGSTNEAMNAALRLSVLCLLGILLVIMILFAKFFISIGKK